MHINLPPTITNESKAGRDPSACLSPRSKRRIDRSEKSWRYASLRR